MVAKPYYSIEEAMSGRKFQFTPHSFDLFLAADTNEICISFKFDHLASELLFRVPVRDGLGLIAGLAKVACDYIDEGYGVDS